jgi:hypothetical protein
MNITGRPTFDAPSPGRPGDVDGLLRAFFQAELPNPWPACPEPPIRTLLAPPPASRWTLARSRFALAASVGLIVAGLWALGGKFTGPGEPSGGKPLNVEARRIDPNKVPSKMSLVQDPEDGTKIKVDFFDR